MKALASFFAKPAVLIAVRVLIGVFFAAAGFFKLLQPWEEFAAQIRAYQIIGGAPVDLMAQVLPWVQLVFGALFAIGVLARLSLGVISAMLVVFIPTVLSTIVRGIPLDDCGCFGSIGIKETPPVVLTRDSISLLLSIPLWRAWGLRKKI